MVLFNDRPFEEGEVPSDGDNLSGDESLGDDDSEESDADDDDGDGDDGREAKRRRTDGPPADEGDEADDEGAPSGRRGNRDDLRDSEDEDGDAAKKDAPLDTTAATADPTADEASDQDGSQQQESQQQPPAVLFRELHRRRRNRIRLRYSSGSYRASPSSWTAHALASQLRHGGTPDLLWLACVGVTDAYHVGRLSSSSCSSGSRRRSTSTPRRVLGSELHGAAYEDWISPAPLPRSTGVRPRQLLLHGLRPRDVLPVPPVRQRHAPRRHENLPQPRRTHKLGADNHKGSWLTQQD